MPTLPDVLCFSHLRWDFVFQRPNHLMTRASRESRVFFVEEPLFDAEAPRLERIPVSATLERVIPHLPEGMVADAARDAQRQLIERLQREARIERPVSWFYTPMAIEIADVVNASLVVYDCMDELSAFRGAPPGLRAAENRLFDRADIVFTGGQSLYEAKRAQHPNVHAFPSSVDVEHFRQARRASAAEPRDQGGLRRPRIGFFGVIDERLDRDLLAGVAAARPEWELVVVGPVVKISPASLPRLPNLHYLGAKTYEDLPAYIAGWDVTMMPFARNEATRFISPTKTLEYMAAGKPVVSTSIHDVVRPYGEQRLVRIADDPAAFAAAIEAALAEDPEARTATFDAYLAGTSWDRTWRRMSALLFAAVEAQSRSSGAPRVTVA